MILLITPLLGTIRNYVKYKSFKPLVFIRTPILYFFLIIIFQTNNIWKILILERWIMFIYKTFLSLLKNDYQNKKQKYIQKYNLKY
jgi:hypothetical protein